jgi:hypothetical protein
MTKLLVVACSACLIAPPSCADSHGPPQNFRQVDPTGTYYVVIKADPTTEARVGLPITFEIARRKPGERPTGRIAVTVQHAKMGISPASPLKFRRFC